MASSPPRLSITAFAVLAAVLAVAVMILPMVLGHGIVISPLLLFGAAVIPNFIAYAIPDADKNEDGAMYSRVFYFRVVASVACAFLLLAVDSIAYALG